MPPLSAWYALAGSAALPAYTAYKYAQFAHAPGWYDDEWSFALIVLFVAQLPITVLGIVFAGVSHIEGPAWRRVLVYVGFVAVLGALSGFANFAFDTELGLIIAWAIALQLVILMFAGPQPALARARIDAVTNDAANLFILTLFGGLLAIAAAIAVDQFTRGSTHPVSFEWSDLAWVGAAYFALRAWSAAYACTPAFESRRKGYFQRPWIDWIIVHLQRSPASKE
jgi:hypothetical protein